MQAPGQGLGTQRASVSPAAAAAAAAAFGSSPNTPTPLLSTNRYTQSEDEFASPEEYDQYLETVEDISELLRVGWASCGEQRGGH